MIGFIGLIFANYWLIKNINNKEGKDDYFKYPLIKRVGLIIVIFLLTIAFGYGSYFSILDLPSVLANQPKLYEGKCEIDITHGKGASMDALFEDKDITFPADYYSKAREGNYYCKVRYFKNSEIGKSIRLYKYNGGNQIDIK